MTMLQTSPLKYPWAGGGRKGRLRVPELAQTLFCVVSLGCFIFSQLYPCYMSPTNADKGHSPGEPRAWWDYMQCLCACSVGGKLVTFNWLWLFITVILEITSPCFAIASSLSSLTSPFLLPFRKRMDASRSETMAAADKFLQTYCCSMQKGLWCITLYQREETAASKLGSLSQLVMWKSWPVLPEYFHPERVRSPQEKQTTLDMAWTVYSWFLYKATDRKAEKASASLSTTFLVYTSY